jgi:hypothetical protein
MRDLSCARFEESKHVLRLDIQSAFCVCWTVWHWWSFMILMPRSLQLLQRKLPSEVLEPLEERWRCLLLRWACRRWLFAATGADS